MSRKGLTTGYVTEEQRDVLANLDAQLESYYSTLHNEGKGKSSSSSSEKTPKEEVRAKKTSGNTREHRDGLRSEIVAATEKRLREKSSRTSYRIGRSARNSLNLKKGGK